MAIRDHFCNLWLMEPYLKVVPFKCELSQTNVARYLRSCLLGGTRTNNLRVFSDDGEPMVATEAVQVLDGVGDNDIETLLGFPHLTKAEPYTAKAQVRTLASANELMYLQIFHSMD